MIELFNKKFNFTIYSIIVMISLHLFCIKKSEPKFLFALPLFEAAVTQEPEPLPQEPEPLPQEPDTPPQEPEPPPQEPEPPPQESGCTISVNHLTINEGMSGTYTMVLTSKPTDTVTISFANPSSIQPISNITFTPVNWNSTQTITVSVIHDSIQQGPRTESISHTIQSTDSTYNNLQVQPVHINILDIDTAAIQMNPVNPTLFVKEGTISDSYTIVLTSAPISNVQISVSFDTNQELYIHSSNLSPYIIIFSPANWNIPQAINLSAKFNSGLENRTIVLTHSVQSSDPNYNLYILPNLSVNVEKNTGTKIGTHGFQSGNINISLSNTTVTLPSTVNPAKSFVYCNFRYSSSIPNHYATCQLSSDGSSVEIKTGGGTSVWVNWYVDELDSGISVQRGSTSFSDTEDTKTISLGTSILPGSSFVIVYSRTTNTQNNNDQARIIMGRLVDSNTLELSRNKLGTIVDIEWQVVQMDGAKVQSGLVSLSPTTNSVSVTSLNPINTDNSFLLLNTRADNSVSGVEGNYYIRGEINSPTEISFHRSETNGTVDVSYFLIEMVDGTKVQSGTIEVGTTQITVSQSLSPPVVPARTMVVFSNSTEGLDNAYVDSGTFYTNFIGNPSSQVEFSRHNHENHKCKITWFTIEFQP